MTDERAAFMPEDVIDPENDSMRNPDPIDGLSSDEKVLLAEALTVLRRERGKAWDAACDVAEAQGKRRPSLRRYGIEDIKRLARRFGVKATHWTER